MPPLSSNQKTFKPKPSASLHRIFAVPALLAALSLFGLLSALLGQGGIWFWLSWLALAIPILVVIRYSTKSGRRSVR